METSLQKQPLSKQCHINLNLSFLKVVKSSLGQLLQEEYQKCWKDTGNLIFKTLKADHIMAFDNRRLVTTNLRSMCKLNYRILVMRLVDARKQILSPFIEVDSYRRLRKLQRRIKCSRHIWRIPQCPDMSRKSLLARYWISWMPASWLRTL